LKDNFWSEKNWLVDGHNVVHANGKHTVFGWQHELIIHTDVFNEHVFVILLQDSKIEQRLAGAQ
jgi:hypothetical protein